jgi:dTDP-4-dehydrorhamnose 3,5-epimerase-like enzyme
MTLSPELIPLRERRDPRGWLVAVEEAMLGFDLKRVFYIGGTPPGTRRGAHAHYRTRQVGVCIQGACSFLLDDGRSKVTVVLDRHDRGLAIEPMVWHEMFDFTADCVLLVLADQPYAEADYIRDYSTFVRVVAA